MTDLDRFMSKVDKRTEAEGGCWLWLGSVRPNGYGQFWMGGTNVLAHRAAHRLLVGEIPTDKHVDHLCRVRHCVNPAHIEPVDPVENYRRGLGNGAAVAARVAQMRSATHCTYGHRLDEDNTYVTRQGWRRCATCDIARSRRYQAKRSSGR